MTDARWMMRMAKAGRPAEPATPAPGGGVYALRDGRAYVYFIGGDEGPVKIGFSGAPHERVMAFQIGSPIKLKLLAKVEGTFADEEAYHDRFAAHRSHGEWFERCPEILAEIDRLNA